MTTEYNNGFNNEECTLLAYSLDGARCFIELDGVRGWCSVDLIEEVE